MTSKCNVAAPLQLPFLPTTLYIYGTYGFMRSDVWPTSSLLLPFIHVLWEARRHLGLLFQPLISKQKIKCRSIVLNRWWPTQPVFYQQLTFIFNEPNETRKGDERKGLERSEERWLKGKAVKKKQGEGKRNSMWFIMFEIQGSLGFITDCM